jgi:uncharacterized membrane protein YdjX (TVP38/TMEM64 family)
LRFFVAAKTMREFFRAAFLIALVLAVPIIPFLIFGASFEERVEYWLQQELSTAVRFTAIVALLAGDILLPIPSSAVSTYGGGVLGTPLATAASWIGMTTGGVLGFSLARAFGRRFASRFAASADLDRVASVCQRFGPMAILLTRPLPILAEACVLLVGATDLSWRRFLIPLLAANFGVSLAYAAVGEYFGGRGALGAAVIAAALLPLGWTLLARRWLGNRHQD